MTHLLVDVGHGLRESFFMFWETLWALVLGFGLAGAVQAFVPRDRLERLLGGHGPMPIGRAMLFGAASSSCSYAAAAMAKALFVRGADFVSSMAFMLASTNLVIELGIVLWVLIGWQFAAAEIIGGLVMIALFALLAPRVFDRGELERIRARLDHLDSVGAAASRDRGLERRRLASRAGWADAASYALADARMLRLEIAIGYLVAGFLSVLVPTSVWRDVFLSGHGFATSLENVVVGPAVAIASFVCSVGNVPLAAALWHGGISFGGVVSFVFADLLTLPLLLVYRRYYGTRTTLRLLIVFWVVMSAAGLAVEEAFRLAGIAPAHRRALPAGTSFHFDATFYLDVAFALVAAVLYWLARNQRRLGGGATVARDPVCGMQVEVANAAASMYHRGDRVYFCSDHCRTRFAEDPDRYATRADSGDRLTPDAAHHPHGPASP